MLFNDALQFADANSPAVSRITGYSREEILHLTVRDLTPIADRERIPGLWAILLTGGALSGEYTILCKSGETRDVEYRSVAGIQPGLHLSVVRDITERKQDEEELKRRHNLLQAVIEVAFPVRSTSRTARAVTSC